MRALTPLLSLAFGCGRIGFTICTGCDNGTPGALDSGVDRASNPTGIKRVQMFAPGSGPAPLTFSVDQIAGDFMIAATYASDGANSVSDSLGETWMSLPGESFMCQVSAVYSLRLFYAQLKHTGSNSIAIAKESPGSGVGGFLIEYSGVASTNPIDNSTGELGGTATANFDDPAGAGNGGIASRRRTPAGSHPPRCAPRGAAGRSRRHPSGRSPHGPA
jgi:hypothetical protein